MVQRRHPRISGPLFACTGRWYTRSTASNMNRRNRSTYSKRMHLVGRALAPRSIEVLTLTTWPNNQRHILIGGELSMTMPMWRLLVLWAPGAGWE